LSGHALPAVMRPSGRNAGLSCASPSAVVPGRGPIASVKDFTEYRAMLATIRDRVQSGIREGKNLEQILAAKPTAEYEEAKKGTGELVVNRTGADLVKWIYQDLSSNR